MATQTSCFAIDLKMAVSQKKNAFSRKIVPLFRCAVYVDIMNL